MTKMPEIVSPRFLVLLVSIPFVEIAVTVFMTRTLGAGLTFSLFAIPTTIGLLIQWFRWKKIKPIWIQIRSKSETYARNNKYHEADKAKMEFTENPEFINQVSTLINFWLSVILLLIPGFVTDVYAFYLMYSSRKNIGLAS